LSPPALGTDVALLGPVISVSGAELPASLTTDLVSVRVERGLRQVGRAELTFVDSGFARLTGNKEKFQVEADLRITVGPARTVVFEGVVTGLRIDQEGQRSSFTVVADEKTYVLASRQKATVFASMTDAEVTTKMLRDAGLTTVVEPFATEVHEHRLVTDSPLRWLERVCDVYGVEWWWDGGVHVDKASAGTTQIALDVDGDVAWLHVEAQDAGPGSVHTRTWDDQRDEPVLGDGSSARPLLPDVALFTGAGSVGKAGATREVTVPVTGSHAQSSAKAQGEALVARARESRVVLRLETFGLVAGLAPRTKAKLQNAGPLNGTYPVTAVTHVWDVNGGRTRILAGPRRPVSLGAVIAEGAPGTPGGRYDGILVGQVTNIDDPKKQGRIKVQLPTLGASIESEWARVLIPGGGKGRGLVALPQVGDQVIVGFEERDLQRPLVLGTVYSGKKTPPEGTAVKSGQAPSAGFTSANGHTLLLWDESEPAKDGVHVVHKKGHEVAVMGDRVQVKTAAGTPISLESGSSSFVIDKQGNITITGMKVVIEGKQGVEVKGLEVKVEAQTTLDLKADVTASLKANAMVSVEGSGSTAIKGGTVQIN
jgi:phage baseplate assembly protein gpV